MLLGLEARSSCRSQSSTDGLEPKFPAPRTGGKLDSHVGHLNPANSRALGDTATPLRVGMHQACLRGVCNNTFGKVQKGADQMGA